MSRRTVQVVASMLAGAVLGVAWVELPLRAPVAPAGGAPGVGPPPDAPQAAPAAPEPSADLVPAAPADEDWLDAHLRQAPAQWAQARDRAADHTDAAVRALAPQMDALASGAPAPGAEVLALEVVVPYLSEELRVWLALPPSESAFAQLDAHMAPLTPPLDVLQASRSAVPGP